jgi:cell wall-associated NlpC family hydrolase
VIPLTGFRSTEPARGLRTGRPAVVAVILGAGLLLIGLAAVPMMVVGGSNMLFAAGGNNCPGGGQSGGQNGATTTAASSQAKNSIPANYLTIYQQTGQKYGIPWPILAGIGEVESDHGRSTLPGVRSGANAFGAAGPMQIGIGGAAGNTWGGAPVQPASQQVSGVATDANGDGTASVYDPADAVAGAAKYLVAHGVQSNVQAAIFAYNHLTSYVQAVMSWASTYSRGGFTVSQVSVVSAVQCATLTGGGAPGTSTAPPNRAAAIAIAYAEAQIGKPYLWGGTGPDAFDCSGLVMMAYRQAGVIIPRTSQLQWAWGPQIQPGHEMPGDLVFFAGSDGTPTSPGHVGMVIGKGKMVEAYATGFPIRISTYGTSASPGGDAAVVGFTRPWAHAGVVLAGTPAGG